MPQYDSGTHRLLGFTWELSAFWKPEKYYVSWTQLAEGYFEYRKGSNV